MNIQSIRRHRLARLIKQRFGTQTKFIEQTGENQGEVSALLRDKSFGEKKARKIESKCGLEPGWLDQLEEHASKEIEQELLEKALLLSEHTYSYLPEISEVIKLMNNTDEIGRGKILYAAKEIVQMRQSIITTYKIQFTEEKKQLGLKSINEQWEISEDIHPASLVHPDSGRAQPK